MTTLKVPDMHCEKCVARITKALTEAELADLLANGARHYSERYACAYLTGQNAEEQELVAWYLDRQAVQERTQLARAFEVDQLCLTDWSGAVRELLTETADAQ